MLLAQEEDWVPAVEADGKPRKGAWVTELTHLVNLDKWGTGIRLICRRERPHPGAQLSLFDIQNGWRHTCFITNLTNNDLPAAPGPSDTTTTSTTDDDTTDGIAAIEVFHRGHARVEDRVQTWKDTGIANLPADSFTRNEAWALATLIATCLIAWNQLIGLTGHLAKAEPKTLRHRILGAPATTTRRGRDLIIRFPRNWPWTPHTLTAIGRIRTAFP